MALVRLGGRVADGRSALVDDGPDADLVGRYAWHATAPRGASGRVFGPYPVTTLPRDGGGTPVTLTMARLLTGWDRTLHANGDTLDCRRANLIRDPARGAASARAAA